MIESLDRFEKKEPELVLTWNDSDTDAKGWLVINSLKGGAAGGGTRMKKGIDFHEVLLLAKTMEIKFTVSGPAIGGAKSGIDFDPFDPRKKDVLRRWYKAILPMLKNCYGTGGDLNVDFINEVIPHTQELGLLHPQEGILEGHLGGYSKTTKAARLSEGASKFVLSSEFAPDMQSSLTVADLISGYSVAESVIQYYKIFNETVQGKKAIIQGWGNVASSAGYYLSKSGFDVIGILDKDGGVFNEAGFTDKEVEKLFIERKSARFSGFNFIPFNEMNELFWSLPANVFIPAAASKLVTKSQINSMINSGVELISCGANVPFADEANFFGEIAEYADNQLSVIPDFIANCGMARVFAYMMQDDAEVSDQAIFDDVSSTVKSALIEVCEGGNKCTQIARSVYQLALE